MTYLNLITPINIAEEQEKIFSSQTYSPQFKYRWDAISIEKYKVTKPELAELANALVSQNKSEIEHAGKTYFDVEYRADDLKLAKSLVHARPTESNGTAQDIAAMMVDKLKELGIDYGVEIVDKHGFQCRPDHNARVIRLSKYLHLQFYPTESVVNHELVHIIRAVNGKANGITPATNYLPTEEGLACLVQDKFLEAPSASAFQHALEYLASYIARDAGFREVYQFFLDHGCDEENAWLRSIRQKFGLRNTSLPGSLMKSGMYFYHEQLLRELDKSELIRLFVGKIPLAQLPKYPDYMGELSEEVIEAFLDS